MRTKYNYVELEGRLGADPEVKYFESGRFVSSFSIAVYQGKNADGTYKPSAWIDIKSWEFEDATNLKKGDRVHIVGQFGVDTWTDRQTGKPRSKNHILVNAKFEGHQLYLVADDGGRAQTSETHQPATFRTSSSNEVEDYDDIPF